MRATRRWGRRLLAGALGVLGVAIALLALVHTPAARALVLQRLAAVARSKLGVELAASRLDYNLLSLTVTLHDLRLDAAGDTTTSVSIRRLEVDLASGALRGRLAAERVVATGVGITIRGPAAGIPPRPATGSTTALTIPPFEVARLIVNDLDVMYDDPAGFGAVVVRDLSLDAVGDRPRHLAGRLTSTRGCSIVTNHVTVLTESIDGRVAFDGSTLSLDPLSVRIATGTLDIRGTLAALAPVHTLDLRFTGHADLSEVATWAPALAPASGLTRLSGHVVGTFGQPSVSFEGNGDQTGLPFLRLANWRGAGSLDRASLRIDRLDASTPAGDFAASGRLSFEGDGSVVDLSWRNVALARVPDWLPGFATELPRVRTSGSGRLTWRGTVPTIDTLEGALRADLGGGTGPGAAAGVLDATGGAGRWTFKLDQRLVGSTEVRMTVHSHLDAGALANSAIEGTASIRSRDIEATLRELAALGLPLPEEMPGLSTGLTAIEARLGGTAARPSVIAHVDAQAVSLGGGRPLHVVGIVGVDQQFVRLEGLSATGPLGNTIHAQGTLGVGATPGEGTFTLGISELGPFAAAAPERWRPTGTLAIEGAWKGTLDSVAASLSMSSAGIDLAGTSFSSLEGKVDVSSARFDVRTLTLRQDGGGTLDLSAAFDFGSHEGTLTARARGLNVVAGRVAPDDVTRIAAGGLDLDIDLAGPIDRPTGRVRASAGTLKWRDSALGAISATAESAGGMVRLEADAPRLASTLHASLSLADPWTYEAQLEARETELPVLFEALGIDEQMGASSGALGFSVHAAGTLASLADARIKATLHSLEGSVLGQPLDLAAPSHWRVADGALTTDGLSAGWGPTRLVVEGHTAPDGTTSGIRGVLQSRLEDVQAALALAQLEGWQVTGAVEATVEAREVLTAPRIEGRLTIADAAVARGDQIVASGIAASVDARDGVLSLSESTASVLEGTATASGRIPASWLPPAAARFLTIGQPSTTSAVLDVGASLPVAGVYDWLTGSRKAKVEGGVGLNLHLEASSPRLDDIIGTLVVEQASLVSGDLTIAQREPANLTIGGGRIDVQNLHLTGPKSEFWAEGFIGLTAAHESNLRVYGSGTLRLIDLFLPGLASGRANFEAQVRGKGESRRVTAVVDLDNASLAMPTLRLSLADWTGRITLNRRGIEANSLTGQLNGGDVTVAGFLPIGTGAAPPDPMSVRARSVLLEIPKGLRTEADADLSWQRSGATSAISGAVTINSGAYREPVTQMIALVQTFSARPTAESSLPAWLDALALDVTFTASEALRLENSVASAEFLPNVRLIGTVGEPALQGELQALEDGRLRLGGRTYRMLDSEISFAPATGVTPTLNIQAETRVGDYEVYLRLTGPPDAVETSLTSNPPLGERDLRSLLLTGRTTGVTGEAAGGEGFAMGAVSADVLGFAGSFVGFDAMSFGQTTDLDLVAADVDPATRFTVTKRLGDLFEVILSQNLDENELTWVVVYKPGRRYQIRVSSRDNLEETIEFRHEIDFGPGGRAKAPEAGRKRSEATITAVDLTGEASVDPRELRSLLALDSGDRFDFAKWQGDHERLERFFRDRGYLAVRVVPRRKIVDDTPGHQQVALEYRIEQGPTTFIEVRGYTLPKAVRAAVAAARADAVFASIFAEDAAELVRDHLVDEGFLRAEVGTEVVEQTDDLERVVLSVTPGPKTLRREVEFSGNSAVDIETLQRLVGDRAWLRLMWRDPEPLLLEIRRVYASEGYLRAEVTARPIVFDGDLATRQIAIVEGPRARIASVSFNGLHAMSTQEAIAAAGTAEGEPYAGGDERSAGVRLRNGLRELGYADARVVSKAGVADDGTNVALAFTVDEGAQQVVRSVRIEGLDATNRRVAQLAVTIKPGEPARPSDAIKTQRELYQRGMFRKADIVFEPEAPAGGAQASSPVPVDALVSVEEFKKYSLRYGISLSNEDSPGFEDMAAALGVAADLRDRNFLGRGWGAGVGGRYEKNLWSVRTLFTVPRLGSYPIVSNVYFTVREEINSRDEFDIRDDETDLQMEQRWRPFSGAELTWGYMLDWRDVTIEQIVGEERRALFRITGKLASLNLTGVIDRRDSPFDATRGWLHSSSLQWGLQPLGSDFGYARYLIRQFGYQPVGPFVLAGGFRWGSIWALDGVPPLTSVDLFFKAGGSQTVRGYEDESLSAVDLFGVPVGGPELLVLNGEVRFPIFKWFKGVLFVDAGNTFTKADDITFDALAVGTGFGLRINTPLAPIRLDLAYPLDRRPGDQRYRWHFSIGQMF